MNSDLISIYHGSQQIVKKPEYGIGNIHNDYGQAFYCTEIVELAKEWACTNKADGFVNKYTLDVKGLQILNLDNGEYNILNWLAILLENRVFRLDSDLMKNGKQYLLDYFRPDYENYDVIIGYRADDSYFSFASAFLSNAISLEKLQAAMFYGNLGEQIAIRSPKAFEKMKFVEAMQVDRSVYYAKKFSRDEKARNAFREAKQTMDTGTYLIDIIRQQWRNEDERLQRIIPR